MLFKIWSEKHLRVAKLKFCILMGSTRLAVYSLCVILCDKAIVTRQSLDTGAGNKGEKNERKEEKREGKNRKEYGFRIHRNYSRWPQTCSVAPCSSLLPVSD
jgi:hypothetical protein